MRSLLIKSFGLAVSLMSIGFIAGNVHADNGNMGYGQSENYGNYGGNKGYGINYHNDCDKPGNGYRRGNDNGNGYGNTEDKPGNGKGYCKNDNKDHKDDHGKIKK